MILVERNLENRKTEQWFNKQKGINTLKSYTEKGNNLEQRIKLFYQILDALFDVQWEIDITSFTMNENFSPIVI